MLTDLIVRQTFAEFVRVKHGQLVLHFVAQGVPGKFYSVFRVNKGEKILLAALFEHSYLVLWGTEWHAEAFHELVIIFLRCRCLNIMEAEKFISVPVVESASKCILCDLRATTFS